ncbi:hypothetical protein ACFLT1_00385 [Bacteroidota bacterium]
MLLNLHTDFSPSSFHFPVEKQYHVLKHFTEVDPSYKEELLAKTACSEKELQKRLQRFGSKFYPDFALNPLEVFPHIVPSDGNEINYRMQSFQRIELQVFFAANRYPDGIGTDTLVVMSDIAKDAQIKSRNRKGYNIHYAVGTPKPTWELNCIFEREREDWHLITMFPGMYAPPFPDEEEQNEEEFNEYKTFWDEHLFVME